MELIGKRVQVDLGTCPFSKRSGLTWIGPVSHVGKDREGRFMVTPTGTYWHDVLAVENAHEPAAEVL